MMFGFDLQQPGSKEVLQCVYHGNLIPRVMHSDFPWALRRCKLLRNLCIPNFKEKTVKMDEDDDDYYTYEFHYSLPFIIYLVVLLSYYYVIIMMIRVMKHAGDDSRVSI